MAAMNKSAFDAYRQQVWEQGAYLVDNKNAAKNNGTLTPAMLSTFIISLSTLMASFNDTYQASRLPDGANPFTASGIPGSWIDSRFHDYYDFFTARIREWEAELQGMTAAQSTIVATAPFTGSTGSTSQYASTNPSQASAAGEVIPQAPYVAPQTGLQPTTQPFESFEQTGFAAPEETQTASMAPLLIGGLVVGMMLFGKKKAGAK
jgi:hypothetical protein